MFRQLPRLQRLTARRRWPVAMLLAGLLLSGQLLALDHLHLDASPEAPCWVCVHGDGTPLADAANALDEPAQTDVRLRAAPLTQPVIAPLRTPQHSRAPPRS